MTFEEYIVKCAETFKSQTNWRMGQTYYNVLHEVRPKLAHEVNATWRDPFYDDSLLPYFLQWVAEGW